MSERTAAQNALKVDADRLIEEIRTLTAALDDATERLRKLRRYCDHPEQTRVRARSCAEDDGPWYSCDICGADV